MKRVVSPSQVCHLFANGAQSDARSGSCSFTESTREDGTKLHIFRSYSTVIAIRVEGPGRDPFILMTEREYSVTTSGQKHRIRCAARHIPVAKVNEGCWRRLEDLLDEEALYNHWLKELIELEAAIGEGGKRKAGKAALAFRNRLKDAHECYAIVTGGYLGDFVYPSTEEIRFEFLTLIDKAEREHIRRSNASRHTAATSPNFRVFGGRMRRGHSYNQPSLTEEEKAERLAQWRAGENVRPYYGMPMSLRVQGDEVVTSEGARVSLRRAVAFYRRITNGHVPEGEAVGQFKFSGFDGVNIAIGCHTIPLAEMTRLYDTLTPAQQGDTSPEVTAELSPEHKQALDRVVERHAWSRHGGSVI